MFMSCGQLNDLFPFIPAFSILFPLINIHTFKSCFILSFHFILGFSLSLKAVGFYSIMLLSKVVPPCFIVNVLTVQPFILYFFFLWVSVLHKLQFSKSHQQLFIVHWICTMVIRPVLSCSSSVWWPRATHNVSRTELKKLQSYTHLVINGGDEVDHNNSRMWGV